MLVKGLDTATPTLRDLARQVGVSYGALRAYRLGTRTPSPRVLRKLIGALRGQAGRLTKVAKALEQVSKQKPGR